MSAPSPVGALARVEVGEKRVKEGSRNGAPSRLWRSHRPPGRTRRLRGFRPRAPSARAKRCLPRRSAVVRSLATFAALNTTKHDTSVSDVARLDAVREVVAGLAVVVRGVERAANLLDDALAREDTLPPDTEDAKHGLKRGANVFGKGWFARQQERCSMSRRMLRRWRRWRWRRGGGRGCVLSCGVLISNIPGGSA